jgi:hypothetical protein
MDVADECKKQYNNFFFQRQCALRLFLGGHPDGFTALAIDSDVIAGTKNESLDRWMDATTDLVFGQFEWSYELIAGCFLVRNSAFSRRFLQVWSDYDSLNGLNADNGAIGLVVLEALGITSRDKCMSLYPADPLSSEAWEKYVDINVCIMTLLGPAREWRIPRLKATITIWPRRFFIASTVLPEHGGHDARYASPFIHPIKTYQEVKSSYRVEDNTGRNGTNCVHFNPKFVLSPTDAGNLRVAEDVELGMKCKTEIQCRVPRWPAFPSTCGRNFSCRPLSWKQNADAGYAFSKNGTWFSVPWVRPQQGSTGRFEVLRGFR